MAEVDIVLETNGNATGQPLGSFTIRYDFAYDDDDDIAIRRATLVEVGMTTEHLRILDENHVYIGDFDAEDVISAAATQARKERAKR